MSPYVKVGFGFVLRFLAERMRRARLRRGWRS